MALRASLCYPLVPPLPSSVHKLLLLLSIPEPSFSLSFPLERSLPPCFCWAWWEIAPCQAVQQKGLKSPSSPPGPPPSPGGCSAPSPPCAGTPHRAPASGCAARQWGGGSAGLFLGVPACSVASHVCPHPPLFPTAQPGLIEPLEVHMSPCPPPWSLWEKGRGKETSCLPRQSRATGGVFPSMAGQWQQVKANSSQVIHVSVWRGGGGGCLGSTRTLIHMGRMDR